ncbi:MAG TPA: hypothetical protein VFI08_08025 [Spirochaetia bacterium]|nr:hypothetical protein [Spirochaetia bacterium]
MQISGTTGRLALGGFLAACLTLAGCTTTGSMAKGDSMAGGMTDKGSMNSPAMADAGSMKKDSMAAPMMAMDPMKAEHAVIDRFSAAAGHLQVRDGMNNLPGPNQPVDFDKAPFVTQGLGPKGETVEYYNFDVQSTTPAPLYVLYRKGEMEPVAGQLSIVDVIPGDAGYNDFWQVNKVTVPADYAANTIGSLKAIQDAGYPVEKTGMLVNCPIVPDGSTAAHRLSGSDTGLHTGWYRNKIVSYFVFNEAPLMVDSRGMVPTSPIYVAFNVNPGMQMGGPASGFKMAAGSMQTHNVVAALPGDMHYSPLWQVSVYDSGAFGMVMDLSSAMHAMAEKASPATVNCPIFSVGSMGGM